MEQPGAVTIKGQPFTRVGPVLNAGGTAPDAELVANDFSLVQLSA
jgi:peroxiredoxin